MSAVPHSANSPRSVGLGDRFRNLTVLAGRNLVHIAREPLQLSDVTVQPVLFTILFVYVFGSGVALPGGASYADFAIAGLLALNLTTSAMGTAVGLSTDLTTGVIDRFRTLPIWRPAVLVGRTLTDLVTATICTSSSPSPAWSWAGAPMPRFPRCSPGSACPCCSASPCPGPPPAWASSARAPNRLRVSA